MNKMFYGYDYERAYEPRVTSASQSVSGRLYNTTRENMGYSSTQPLESSKEELLKPQAGFSKAFEFPAALAPHPFSTAMSTRNDPEQLQAESISSRQLIEKEVSEIQCYEFFDKMWISSNQQEETLKDQWNCLVEKITKEDASHQFQMKEGASVTGLFHLCRELDTNFIVRFRALELYERYLHLFAEEMGGFLTTCSKGGSKEFFARFELQILLRMCTCILIASKLHSDTQTQALHCVDIKQLLKKKGYKFSCKSVSLSELRVLKTLNYRCHWVTPIDVIEQLLGMLKLNLKIQQRTHYFCILLLEYYYSDIENIRLNFSSRKTQGPATPGNGNTVNISSPLQCAAIVSAALFIVSTESKDSQVHKRVIQTTSLPEEDIHDLAVIILDLLNASP